LKFKNDKDVINFKNRLFWKN